MFKRLTIPCLVLGLALLSLIPSASAYLYKKPSGHDCGKAIFTGGFGGPGPSNVPTDAKPQIDTFIVRGTISCTQAKHVMAAYEKSFDTTVGSAKGISPAGWKCAFSKKQGGDECVSHRATISNGIVYVLPNGTHV
jgi:hypothetical protein